MKSPIEIPSEPLDCRNLVGTSWIRGSGPSRVVHSPLSGAVIGTFCETTPADIEAAVQVASESAWSWASQSLKDRCQIMFKVREILHRDIESIAHLVSSESGKTLAESHAGILKGIEVLEFALSLQNLDIGGRMEVSNGIHCEYRREPLGVVAGVTPFNFPAMVPMWMLPIAITLGNAFIWKPSDKTPLTSIRLGAAFLEAGLPPGVLTILQGAKATVEGLLDTDRVSALAFVGSTAVAKDVYSRGTKHHKRILALGGAKNHIILMPDADRDMAVDGVLASFTGCAGQRCMAASVLLAVGDTDDILRDIQARATKVELGAGMGAIISKESLDRLETAIARAEADGASLVVDGRNPNPPGGCEDGYWLSPCIIDHAKPDFHAATEELFGPVLTIIRCKTLSEAMAIERKSIYGNAASVFTSSGAVAERVSQEASAGMIGVNIGVPVPREPFSFGGIEASKFGHGDITGHGCLDFWSNRKKVTSKWVTQNQKNWMS